MMHFCAVWRERARTRHAPTLTKKPALMGAGFEI